MDFQFILIEQQVRPHVSVVRLNRPKELNALNLELMTELVAAL